MIIFILQFIIPHYIFFRLYGLNLCRFITYNHFRLISVSISLRTAWQWLVFLYHKMAEALSKVPDVEIDPEGKFKYILVNIKVKGGTDNKLIVRGTKSAEYHSKWRLLNAEICLCKPTSEQCPSSAQYLSNQLIWR